LNAVVGNVLSAWREAFAARDVDALVALYAPAALFFGSQPRLFNGRTEIREYFESLPPIAKPKVAFSDVVVAAITPDVLTVAMLAAFSAEGRGVLHMRLTQTLAHRGGQWLIAAHHASPA